MTNNEPGAPRSGRRARSIAIGIACVGSLGALWLSWPHWTHLINSGDAWAVCVGLFGVVGCCLLVAGPLILAYLDARDR